METDILSPTHVSFPVADVTPGTQRLPETTLRAMFERTAHTHLLTCANPDQKIVDGGDFHPLIAAAAVAYKQHFPLALSADMLWLTILQGVAQHVANQPETFRSRLVSHQTKIELVVDPPLNGLPETNAQMLVPCNAFVAAISKHVPAEKRFLLNTEFSTTTDVERIAGSMVVMETFRPYFDYVFRIVCGIPSVTLEGTTADWELLASKVQLLHDSDLELSWWTTHLQPLCDHFVRASRGDVDQAHWKNLCKLVERYGADDLNGWLLKFIPYVRKDRNEMPTHRNPVLHLTSFDNQLPQSSDSHDTQFLITGCTSNMLPTGISRVPVTCQNDSGENQNLQFFTGFVGVSQSHEDLSIRPVVSWAIAEHTGIDALIDKLQAQHRCIAHDPNETHKILEAFGGSVSGDMWKFYSEIKTAYLTYKKPNQYGETSCCIADLNSIKPLWDANSVEAELDALHESRAISAELLAQRKEFAFEYGRLRVIGQAGVGKKIAFYVFGELPGLEAKIFRWNGKRNPEAFSAVAKSFTEWLATILQSTSPSS
jgi:hypothetical protein